MKEEYVSFEIARKLKECGFDWECHSFYSLEPDGKPLIFISALGNVRYVDLKGRDVVAPTLSMAQKWLREVKGISVEPLSNLAGQWNVNVCEIGVAGEVLWAKIGCDTYELALSAGIDSALTILK